MSSPGPSFLSCPPTQPHRYPNSSRDFKYKNGPPHCDTFNNGNWVYIPPPYPSACPPCPTTQPPNSHFSPPTGHPPPYSHSYISQQPPLPLTPPQPSYPPFPQLPQSSPYTVPPPPFPTHNQATFPPPLPNCPPPEPPSPSHTPPLPHPSPSHTPPLPPPSYTPPPLPLSPPPVPPSPPPLPPSPPPTILPLPPSPPTTPCNNDPQVSFEPTECEDRKKIFQIRDENLKGRHVDNQHPQKIQNSKGKKRKSISSCDDDVYLPNKWKKIEDLIERIDNEEQKRLQSNCRIEASYTSKDHDRNKNSLHFRKDYFPKKNMSLYDLSKAKSMSNSTRRSSCDSHQRQRKEEIYNINCRKVNNLLHVQENYEISKHKRRIYLDISLSDEEDSTEGYDHRNKSYFTPKDLDSNSRWKKVYESLKLDDDTKPNVDGSLQDLSEAYDSYYNLNDHQKVSYNGSYFKNDNHQKYLFESNKSYSKTDNYCTVKSEIHVVKNTRPNSTYSRERNNSINDSNFDTESIYSTEESDNGTDRSSKKISNKLNSQKNTRNKYELSEYKDKSFLSENNYGLDSDSSMSTTFDHYSNNSKSNLKYLAGSVYHVDSVAKSDEISNTGYYVDELITNENYLEKSHRRHEFSNELDGKWTSKMLNGKDLLKNNSNSPNNSEMYIESLDNIKNLNNDFICSSFIDILKNKSSNRHILENNYKFHNEKILDNNYKNTMEEDTDFREEIFMLKGNWSHKPEYNDSGNNLLKNKSSTTQGKKHKKYMIGNSKQHNHILDLANLDFLDSNDCSNTEIYPCQVEKFNEKSFFKKVPDDCPEYSNDLNKSHSKESDVAEIFVSPDKSFCGNTKSNATNRTETYDSDNENHRTNISYINQCHSKNMLEDMNICHQYKECSTTLPHIESNTNKNTKNKSDFSQVNMSNNAYDQNNVALYCQLQNENKECYLSETRFPNPDNKNRDLMNKEEITPQNDGLDSIEIRDSEIKINVIFENTVKDISSIKEKKIEGKINHLGNKSPLTYENYSLENKTTDEVFNDINYNMNMKKHNKENISNKVEKVESPLNKISEQNETPLSYDYSKILSKDIFKCSDRQNNFRSDNSFLVLNENIEKNILNLNADHNTNIQNKEFSCTKCKRKFSTLGGLKEHLLYHKGGTFECVKCGDKFFKLIDMTTHIKDHIEVTHPSDAVCSHGNKDDDNISEKEGSGELNENNKSVKEEHEKSYKYDNLESNHHKKSLSSMKLPTKKRKTKYYSCSYCDYKSKRERFLLKHLQKHSIDVTTESSQFSGDDENPLL